MIQIPDNLFTLLYEFFWVEGGKTEERELLIKAALEDKVYRLLKRQIYTEWIIADGRMKQKLKGEMDEIERKRHEIDIQVHDAGSDTGNEYNKENPEV